MKQEKVNGITKGAFPMREFTSDMREISGFGGWYEAGCRLMVLRGIEWLEKNPKEDDWIERLENYMVDHPTLEGVSGAAVSASRWHAIYANKIGWEAYCKLSRKMQNMAGTT